MTRQVVVVLDDLHDIDGLERWLVAQASSQDTGFHLVSTGSPEPAAEDDPSLGEQTPRAVGLMRLMMGLAERLIPVTGEVVSSGDFDEVAVALSRVAPQEILVASRAPRLADLIRPLVEIDVRELSLTA